MKLIAHLTTNDNNRKEQTLQEHCVQTAVYAAESIGSSNNLENSSNESLKKVNLYHTVYLAGMLHDFGKAKREFIQYIEGAYEGKKVIKGSVNHTFAGVIWLMKKFHTEESSVWEKMTSEIIAFAVGAHHGMFDCVDLDGKNGFLYRLEKDKDELYYEESVYNYFNQVIDEAEVISHFEQAVEEVRIFFCMTKETYERHNMNCSYQAKDSKDCTLFQFSMLARLVLSAIIYGDRRDTREFMLQKNIGMKQDIDWTMRRDYFEEKLKLLSSSSEINRVRADISKQCAEAAERQPGIYRMNVPTGGGKTLSTLRYALTHAEIYHKKRIIFIIPLLSVLDQNVKIIRDYILDKESVLEHHCNVVREKNIKDDLDEFEFLTESWNSPIIVSTLVQLLNMLFSHQTSAIGRMQALCDSVIVIDEVQTLPKRITLMFNMAMNFLQQYCNATIVLSSATQPCFEEVKWPIFYSKQADLVHLDHSQIRVFQRTKINVARKEYQGMDWEECVSFLYELMDKHKSLLIICNTKSEASILFEKMKELTEYEEWDLYHLSTGMCQKHRMDILEEIQNKLRIIQDGSLQKQKDRKIICIATQLVEAGVDFSFEGVVRVMAGIDNLAQAAGRCNRSNEYGHLGNVYLIKLKNENLNMLKEIKKAQISTMKILETFKEKDESIIGEKATQKFYQYLYQEMKKDIEYPVEILGEQFYLAKLLANRNANSNTEKNKNYFFRQPFQTIGKNFKVFDENTVDIMVPYEKGIELIEEFQRLSVLKIAALNIRKLMKQAKLYTVNVFEWQKRKLESAGLLISVFDGRIYILDKNAYDDNIGITFVEEQDVENYVF